jgi:type IV secretion system protein VirB9
MADMVGRGFDDQSSAGVSCAGDGPGLEKDHMGTRGRISLSSSLRAAALGVFALAFSHAAAAQIASVPGPGPGDPRIKEFLYDPDAIVAIRGQLGYELMIEFGRDERIENVSIGDSLSWQVTPNRKATLLFLKPMSRGNPTSMTVVTSERIYSFMLEIFEGAGPADPESMRRLRFLYPEPPAPVVAAPAPPPPPPPPPRPEDFNFDYALSGVKALYPVRVFDDGVVTYFQFDTRSPAPAIFVIGVDGKEEMPNTRIDGDYTVADLIAERFVLRYGNAQAELRNRAWSNRPKPRPAPLPQPSQGG